MSRPPLDATPLGQMCAEDKTHVPFRAVATTLDTDQRAGLSEDRVIGRTAREVVR